MMNISTRAVSYRDDSPPPTVMMEVSESFQILNNAIELHGSLVDGLVERLVPVMSIPSEKGMDDQTAIVRNQSFTAPLAIEIEQRARHIDAISRRLEDCIRRLEI